MVGPSSVIFEQANQGFTAFRPTCSGACNRSSKSAASGCRLPKSISEVRDGVRPGKTGYCSISMTWCQLEKYGSPMGRQFGKSGKYICHNLCVAPILAGRRM